MIFKFYIVKAIFYKHNCKLSIYHICLSSSEAILSELVSLTLNFTGYIFSWVIFFSSFFNLYFYIILWFYDSKFSHHFPISTIILFSFLIFLEVFLALWKVMNIFYHILKYVIYLKSIISSMKIFYPILSIWFLKKVNWLVRADIVWYELQLRNFSKVIKA